MDLRIFLEPHQGATYEDQLTVAREAESLGFDALFRSDHYVRMGSATGHPGPTDAWITLAGLARETTTIRLGTLMTAGTFRYPGPLAISVAQVDQMSGGRIEFGIGAGWFEAEHTAYGIPFGTVKERFDRLEEQLEIITGLWKTPFGGKYSFEGTHYQLQDSPALPKPMQQPHPPVIIGGRGKTRTPELTARYADEFNLPFVNLDETKAQFERSKIACERIGRDPSTLTLSATQVICVGENDAEIKQRSEKIGRDMDDLRANGLAGSVDEVIEKALTFRNIGATRMYLQFLDLADLDHLRLIAEKIIPAVA